MSDTSLCLKPINDLLGEQFFIPAYQRGYRWTSRQVTELLDDISSFYSEKKKASDETFYCLQPVVVMARPDGSWELIDGQQRLTTLFLIMAALPVQMGALEKNKYSLCYETRENSGSFLEQMDLGKKHDNIDYYHICAAYETIEQWFEGKDGTRKMSFLQCLLNTDDDGWNVKVIWYELPSRDNQVDVFIRLNMGKIPLTSAELIRALFLRSRNFKNAEVTLRQLQIAQEWDRIEKVLQSDDFWYFIHKGNVTYATRIEYLFRLITQELPCQDLMDNDPYRTFIAYNRLFREGGADIDTEWLKVKQYFMTCEEWFRDRTLYHLVGYLINEGEPLLDIKQVSEECGKSEFQHKLKTTILEKLFKGTSVDVADGGDLKSHLREWLGDLSYESQRSKIRSVLLLFNIATLLQNETSNLRFPFDSYKTEQWDIEHIRSVKSDKPARRDDQKSWAERVLDFWADTDDRTTPEGDEQKQVAICEEIRILLGAESMSNEEANERFDSIYKQVLESFEESDSSEVDHGLQNLALLDAHTNRSYGNAVFPIKRRRILGLDKDGTFVPLCTTNAFLKYYSHKIDRMMFWTEEDRGDYFNNVVDTLVTFFAQGNGGAE